MSINVMHFISSPASGGAEVYVKSLAREHKKNGIEVVICFLDRARFDHRDPTFEKKFLSELEDLDIKYFFLGSFCRKFPLWGAWKIMRIAKSEKTDVYHSHLKYGIVFGAFLNIPRVYTHHNIVIEAGYPFSVVANALVDQYVGISKVCSQALEKYTRREVKTIYNSIDIERFQAVRRQERTTEKFFFRLIAVGRIHKQKNYDLLLNTLSVLPPSISSSLKVSIVGDGDPAYTSMLQQRAAELALDDIVEFLGCRSDIPELLEKADLFIMTSAWEGLPISLIEATASGLPSIVTDVGGCGEFLNLTHSGVIVAPDDPSAFARSLEKLLLDSNTLDVLSENARRNVSSFDIRTAERMHVDTYNRLLCV